MLVWQNMSKLITGYIWQSMTTVAELYIYSWYSRACDFCHETADTLFWSLMHVYISQIHVQLAGNKNSSLPWQKSQDVSNEILHHVSESNSVLSQLWSTSLDVVSLACVLWYCTCSLILIPSHQCCLMFGLVGSSRLHVQFFSLI